MTCHKKDLTKESTEYQGASPSWFTSSFSINEALGCMLSAKASNHYHLFILPLLYLFNPLVHTEITKKESYRSLMGNCLTQGAKTWAIDEEWDRYDCIESTSRKLPQHQKVASPPVKSGSTTVKIKLTRKELEEILGKAGFNTNQTLPIELLLKHAMNKRCKELVQDKNRHWQPALQTIPEAFE